MMEEQAMPEGALWQPNCTTPFPYRRPTPMPQGSGNSKASAPLTEGFLGKKRKQKGETAGRTFCFPAAMTVHH